MKATMTAVFAAGALLGVWSTASNAAGSDLPPRDSFEVVVGVSDGSKIAMCAPDSLINDYDAGFFDEAGPPWKSPEEAAEAFISDIALASTPQNPELKQLDDAERQAYVEWFAADFGPARSLTVGEQVEGPDRTTRFRRAMPDRKDVFDVHIEVQGHPNGAFFVSQAIICADAINERSADLRAPAFTQDDEGTATTEENGD